LPARIRGAHSLARHDHGGRPARQRRNGEYTNPRVNLQNEKGCDGLNGQAANQGRRRSTEWSWRHMPLPRIIVAAEGRNAILQSVIAGKARNVNRQPEDTLILELAEEVEDGMKRAHELVKRLDIYCLERKAIRQAERNGFDSWRCQRTLKELETEKKRLASST
jgi:hypothetical protein